MVLFIGFLIKSRMLYDIARQYFSPLGYKTVDIDRMHMTILFIGDPPSITRSQIIKAIREKIIGPPMYIVLKVRGLGLLPPDKCTHIVVFVEPPKEVYEFRHKLAEVVSRFYEIRDRYNFIPHITVAHRLKRPRQNVLERLLAMLKKAEQKLPSRIPVYKPVAIETVRGNYIVYELFS